MIFNSVTYLIFLATAVTMWWLLWRRARLWMIFVASLTFYAFWRIEFLPIMLASTVTDYCAALAIYRNKKPRRRKMWLCLSLFVNLGLLFYFKYLLFFAENATGLLSLVGLDITVPAMSVILPLGISFYTFQTISYTVDVYRGFITPRRDFILFADYVTFFPQLVAGPILRAGEVICQISERRPFHLSHVAIGVRRVLYGLFLKVFLADHLAHWVDLGFAQPSEVFSAVDVWTLAFMFGFQIYFDFSAYSHIAIGSARMMGIVFPENFNYPYIATSPRDFWRRWHISLSSWIRDYLYLPLARAPVHDRSTGGLASAGGAAHTTGRNRALFLTWAIMGLWHGAAWTFVVWGLWHALFVFLYRIIHPWFKNFNQTLRATGGWVLTLAIAMLGWIPFRAGSFSDMLHMYAQLFKPSQYRRLGLIEDTYLIAAVMLVCVTGAYAFNTLLAPRVRRNKYMWVPLESAALCVVLTAVFVFLRPIRQYIYFEF